MQYLATLCAKDWGLYHDVTTNIAKTLQQMKNYTLSSTEREQIQQRLLDIKTAIEQTPKSLQWKLRKRIGTRKTWRSQVEDQTTTPKLEDPSDSLP